MSVATVYARHTSAFPRNLKICRRVLQKRDFSWTSARTKQRMVILGSGWGGYTVLRGIDKKRWGKLLSVIFREFLNFPSWKCVDVTVISPNTYFNFTPLLASTAVGTLEFRTAIEPVSIVRNFCGLNLTRYRLDVTRLRWYVPFNSCSRSPLRSNYLYRRFTRHGAMK